MCVNGKCGLTANLLNAHSPIFVEPTRHTHTHTSACAFAYTCVCVCLYRHICLCVSLNSAMSICFDDFVQFAQLQFVDFRWYICFSFYSSFRKKTCMCLHPARLFLDYFFIIYTQRAVQKLIFASCIMKEIAYLYWTKRWTPELPLY